MIGLGFLASRAMIEGALRDLVREQMSGNLTDQEKEILDFLNKQLQKSKKSSSKKCPECQNNFHVLIINSVEIDCCKTCESLWFDPKELRMVMNDPNDITNEFLHAGKSKYKCPVCNSKMRKRSFLFPERLVVDICPEEHGVYFEKGELEQVFKIQK